MYPPALLLSSRTGPTISSGLPGRPVSLAHLVGAEYSLEGVSALRYETNGTAA
jgi:hypothetical protein